MCMKHKAVVYVTDNYDLSLVVALEFFLACMCMVLLLHVSHVWLTLCMVLLPHVSHVWLTLCMLSFVVDLVIVIYLSYQLSFAAFACLLRDS